MAELLAALGFLQASGGLLFGLLLVVWELRAQRRDFNRHEHDENGKPFIRVLHSE